VSWVVSTGFAWVLAKPIDTMQIISLNVC
jgi:hypothetical protein